MVGQAAKWWGEPSRRAARPTGTTRCQRVAEAVFALDSAFAFVRVEHVERVAVRGLYADKTKE